MESSSRRKMLKGGLSGLSLIAGFPKLFSPAFASGDPCGPTKTTKKPVSPSKPTTTKKKTTTKKPHAAASAAAAAAASAAEAAAASAAASTAAAEAAAASAAASTAAAEAAAASAAASTAAAEAAAASAATAAAAALLMCGDWPPPAVHSACGGRGPASRSQPRLKAAADNFGFG